MVRRAHGWHARREACAVTSMAIQARMATPRVKATYALDVDTVRMLERIARHWKVTKSEALRRAIRSAAASEPAAGADALTALDALQRAVALTPEKARTWTDRVRRERRAASARSERRAG
jgi:hypothetical protein